MGYSPSTEEYEKMRKLRRRPQPLDVFSGAGKNPMPFGAESAAPSPVRRPAPTPSPTTVPEPVTASRPGTVDSPGATRRTISSGVQGLAPDQVGGEIQQAAHDKRIIAERLASTYRAAQQAKMSGNHDEYNRLMDEWQSRLGERRDLETYGRNLSLTQPRDFVTAEQAAKSQAELPGMVRGARERQYRETIAAANDQPNYADIESAAAKQYLDQPVEPAVPFDPAAYTRRIFDAQNRAETASERVAPQVRARQAAAQFRNDYAAGEQKMALADQNRRIAGEDAASLSARAGYLRARRDVSNLESAPAFSQAESLLNEFTTHIKNAVGGDAGSQASAQEAIKQLEGVFFQLSPEQKTEIQNRARQVTTELEQNRPGFWSSFLELVPLASFVTGDWLGDSQKTRQRINSATNRLRTLTARRTQ